MSRFTAGNNMSNNPRNIGVVGNPEHIVIENKINQGYNIKEVTFIDEKKAEDEFRSRLLEMRTQLAGNLFANKIKEYQIQLGDDAKVIILADRDLGPLLAIREEKEDSGYQVLTDILCIGKVYFSLVMK